MVHGLAEITLVAAAVRRCGPGEPADLRHCAGLPTRPLAIGLPLTFRRGSGLAAALFTDLPWELARCWLRSWPHRCGAQRRCRDRRSLPKGIRRSLNVESGLNDGIATPVVTMLIASCRNDRSAWGAVADTASCLLRVTALADVLGGLAIGIAVGYFGGPGGAVEKWGSSV